MHIFLISLATVAVAEMGDRTQLLSLVLAAKFRKPWPIIAGIFCATIANHTLAAFVGVEFAKFLAPAVLDTIIGISLLAMAVWALIPDSDGEDVSGNRRNAFAATLLAFFMAEMGDKTQIATAALAAGYSNLFAVVGGSTAGMMAANVPVVFLGKGFAARLPLRAIHIVAAMLFLALGLWFLARAIHPFGL